MSIINTVNKAMRRLEIPATLPPKAAENFKHGVVKLAREIALIARETQYNTKCEVHMPGHALSMYNDMLLLEKACTDELQGALNAGWRIVAACPQPDQRRPDYILGRFNPDLDQGGSASRGENN